MILNTFLVLGIVLDTVTWCVATHFTDLRSYIGFTGMSSHGLPGQGKHLVVFQPSSFTALDHNFFSDHLVCGILSRSSTWVAGTYVLGPRCTASEDALARSEFGSQEAGTQTSFLI